MSSKYISPISMDAISRLCGELEKITQLNPVILKDIMLSAASGMRTAQELWRALLESARLKDIIF